MKRGSWADDMDRIRAEAVDDTIHVRTLMRLGMFESTIYRRCRDDGSWTLMAPVTVRLSIGTPTRRQLTGLLGIADAYLPEVGLVLPIDSTEHHFATPDQVVETERQHRAYRSAGLHVFGVRPGRITGDSRGLHRDVLDAIAVAEALPTPLVRRQPDLPRSA
jgi:hypothetical protein